MKFSESTINELAQYIDGSNEVYLHKQTGEIIWYPIGIEDYDSEGLWTDILEKVENNPDNYIEFFARDSRDGYRVMEAFAANKVPKAFRDKLFQALDGAKPFRNFKMLIDNSEYRQDWFDFKLEKDMELVREQIQMADDNEA